MKLMKLAIALVFVMCVDGLSDSRCKQSNITEVYGQSCTDFFRCLHVTQPFIIKALWVGGSYGFADGTAVIEWPVPYVSSGDGKPDINDPSYSANYIYIPLEDPWTDAAYMTALHSIEAEKKVMIHFCFDPDGTGKRIIDRIGVMNH